MRAFLLLTCCLLAGGGLLLWTRDAPRGLPHPNLYGVPPPLPPRLRWHAWLLQPWQRWRRWGSAWAPGPPPPPPLPPLPPLRNQGLVGVAYSDPKTGVYLGSPSIARLDADTLLMSHDYFPEWGRGKRTSVYASKDGSAWRLRATVSAQFWSTLFVHEGAAYLLGVDDAEGPNSVSIARSTDGGASWNRSSLLPAPAGCHWATGSVPVLFHQGMLYRGMELWCGPTFSWPQSYQAVVIYAPATADLLDPACWRASRPAGFDSAAMLPAWMPGPVESGGFLEGNAVALPGGRVALLLRCRVYDAVGRTYTLQHACLFHLEPSPAGQSAGGGAGELAHAGGGQAAAGAAVWNEAAHASARNEMAHASAGWDEAAAAQQMAADVGGRQLAAAGRLDQAQLVQEQAAQQPAPSASEPTAAAAAEAGPALLGPMQLTWQGFAEMPGGGNKFTARLDPSTGLYLALTNPSIDRYGANPDARNTLALVFSRDLLSWRVAATLLVANDGLPWDDSLWRTAYQYPDWIIDGADLLVAIRTAWGGAASFHDNNWLTFKRVPNYRRLLSGRDQAA